MEKHLKITKLADCVGCGSKVSAKALGRLLNGLPPNSNQRLIIGYEKNDDACVYALDETSALIKTVDFFPPIVADPYLFGQISAANALSDIYAMGGQPQIALNILALPKSMNELIAHEILRGGYDKINEAGATLAGGHSIYSDELIYGLSVTGFVHRGRLTTNAKAQPGDVLILTKPLGVGILMTASRAGLVNDNLLNYVYEQMAALNMAARNIMVKYPVHACTDITGFGLLGHCLELARGSNCTVCIEVEDVPIYPEALAFSRNGFIPSGAYNNRDFVSGNILEGACELSLQDVLYDPQTSGGLLIAVPERVSSLLLKELQGQIPSAEIIGFITERTDSFIVLK